MRVAAIDVGTNSVLLLVAERRGDEVVPVVERARITRLGEGVDRTGVLGPAAMERTLACLRDYAAELRAAGARDVGVVGTSAMRDAGGAEAFVRRVEEVVGVAPRVVSGDEEARLTFEGALSGMTFGAGARAGVVTVFDVGGGSTEVVRGAPGSGPTQIHSLDVGSVRLTERHVRSDPPSPVELRVVREAARDAFDAVARPAPGEPLVGIAGTVTTIAAVARGIDPYDGARVHGARLPAEEVASTAARLGGLSLRDRRSVPGLDPARADVIVAGAEIVLAAMEWAGSRDLWVSDRGVRWGLVLRLLAKRS